MKCSNVFQFGIILLILSFITSVNAAPSNTDAMGQNRVRIYGTVRDASTGEPLSGAVVMRITADGAADAYEYSVTDSKGEFSVLFPSPLPSGDSLRVSYIGYSTLALVPRTGQAMTIDLEQQSIYIKEVIVAAPKVKLYGDTVSFNVQSFTEEQDRSISDVIKRMPGMEVKDNGKILYNGKEIGGLYVEGEDILAGRYSMVTENLSAQLVKSVEVMDRHQPVKALRGMNPGDKPAINLKLQEKAKGAWVGSASLSGGVSPDPEALWDTRMFWMRIGRKWQSINNFKSNNTGTDIGKELSVLGDAVLSGTSAPVSTGFVSVGTENAPLRKDRVRLNMSALFNTSNSFKINGDWSIRSSAYYSFDRLESANSSATVYYFEDGRKTVRESREAMTREHVAGGNIEATANTDRYFMSNRVSGEMHWRDALQRVSGEFRNVSKAQLPYFSVGDVFRYVRRSGNLAFTVNSDNSFVYNDQNLKVRRDSIPGSAHGMQEQNVRVADFSTDNYLSSDFRIARGLTLAFKGGFNASVRSLESHLSGIDGIDIKDSAMQNDLVSASIRPYISPSLRYESKNWDISLSLPASYIRYTYTGAGVFSGQAAARIKYMPGPRLSFTASGSASLSPLDIKDFYSGYIMKNYRYLTVGSLCTAQNMAYSAGISVNFKDPVNLFYLNGHVSRSWNVMQTSVSQDFLGNYIVLGSILNPSVGNSWSVSADGSVGIYGINGKVSAKLSYTAFSSNSVVQDGVRTPYIYHTVSFSPAFNARLSRCLSMDYRLDYSHLILSVPGSGAMEGKDNFNHSLMLSITAFRRLDLKVTAEHYYATLAENSVKNTVLADLSVAYRLKNRMEIYVTASNILNTRTYAYSVFDSLTEFSCEYRIRPLNVIAGIYIPF